jgi:transaldolase
MMLHAFADPGSFEGVMPTEGVHFEVLLAESGRSGIDAAELAARLQSEGKKAFESSWQDLFNCISSKSSSLANSVEPGRFKGQAVATKH